MYSVYLQCCPTLCVNMWLCGTRPNYDVQAISSYVLWCREKTRQLHLIASRSRCFIIPNSFRSGKSQRSLEPIVTGAWAWGSRASIRCTPYSMKFPGWYNSLCYRTAYTVQGDWEGDRCPFHDITLEDSNDHLVQFLCLQYCTYGTAVRRRRTVEWRTLLSPSWF